MQPRTLEQVLSSLDTVYNPQIESIRQRQSLIPGQIAEEEKGLQAKQTQAFDDILGGARRRGLGFSGIPLGEQARYTSMEFLPALARLKQSGREQAMSLEDAILGIQERRATQGQSIYQFEQQAAEQRRQFEARLAAQRQAAAAQAAAYPSPSFNQPTQSNVDWSKIMAYVNGSNGSGSLPVGQASSGARITLQPTNNGNLQGNRISLQGNSRNLQGSGIRLQ